MQDAIDHLTMLGYTPLVKSNFDVVIEEGPKNIAFTQIISWLSVELQVLCELESCIHPINDPEDSSSFLLEVSSFLKDISCPYSCLTEGPVSQRLLSRKNKELLIQYLCTELEAARIIAHKKPTEAKTMKVEMQESPTAKDLKEMLMTLNFSKPPPTVTPMQIFSKVQSKVSDTLSKLPAGGIEEPLFDGTLSEKQWVALEKLQKQMHEDYTTRREMLIKRLDVTVQSFSWSDRLKHANDKIEDVYTKRRRTLHDEPAVDMSDLLAARSDLAIVEKTSSASVRVNTKSSINDVVIGAVPDRGGRPEEQQPPPPEVPSWQKNEPQRSSFGDSRGGGRGSSSSASSRGGASYRRSDGSTYERGGAAAHDHRAHTRNYSSQGDRAYGSCGAAGVGYAYPNHQQPYQPNYFPPQPVHLTHYYVNPNSQSPDFGFGVGMGGYAATGGNFQQFGSGIEFNDQRGRGGRGQGRRGGGRRAGYNR